MSRKCSRRSNNRDGTHVDREMAVGVARRFLPGEPADDDGLAGDGEGGGVARRRSAGDMASPRRRVDIVCPSELLLRRTSGQGDFQLSIKIQCAAGLSAPGNFDWRESHSPPASLTARRRQRRPFGGRRRGSPG